jgi:NADH-quinone oxidoreductase subunit G
MRIIIDGKPVECRENIPVLQAALEAGCDVPHYCYHPGLSIVASCRLCLMEMKMPHPQTKELEWSPKLVPSCQTMVKDGLEVRFESPGVLANQQHVMEYYLINHPLDCPVCDKAGECYLQDYSEKFGHATSRMLEDKLKNPKKDIGGKTLLYQDRCVLCSRCVRFCQEVAGPGELAIVDRGNRCEIDVFPGVPLENPLQGNVVDLCPVGALLSKDFLFRQRVWLLEHTPSISPADSSGAAIWIDHNEEGIHRIRPRFNERVNQWWISDEQRFGWKFIDRTERLRQPAVRRGTEWQPARWEDLPGMLRMRLEHASAADDGAAVAVVLSPMMSCEEAWLLARFVRGVAPQALLVVGHVPVIGQDQSFPKGFVIRAEKCPNRRGVEQIIAALGGPSCPFDDFTQAAGAGKIRAAYVCGGYPHAWATPEAAKLLAKVEFLVTHDLFASALDATASIRIPSASWAEREGTFMNCDGLVQPFERAIPPIEGVKADGQFFFELAADDLAHDVKTDKVPAGLFRSQKVRAWMAEKLPAFATPFRPREEPPYAH